MGDQACQSIRVRASVQASISCWNMLLRLTHRLASSRYLHMSNLRAPLVPEKKKSIHVHDHQDADERLGGVQLSREMEGREERAFAFETHASAGLISRTCIL